MYDARRIAPSGSIQKYNLSPAIAAARPTELVITSFLWSCAYVNTASF
jgi:hypothetical protein